MQDDKNHATENTQAVMFSKTIGKTTYDVSVYQVMLIKKPCTVKFYGL
jgi:hypothetical protein